MCVSVAVGKSAIFSRDRGVHLGIPRRRALGSGLHVFFTRVPDAVRLSDNTGDEGIEVEAPRTAVVANGFSSLGLPPRLLDSGT